MNRPFRWGILGTANIADTFVRSAGKIPDTEVTAVASRDAQKARKWAAERGIELSFGSYEELLDSGKIDAVYIPLPNSMHAAWCLEAIKRSIPALVEKPFAADAAQARRVAQSARDFGVATAEAFMYRFHPVYHEIGRIIRSGEIGGLKTIFSRFTFLLDSTETIVDKAVLGGGALMDVGCYCVNVSRMIAGAEPTRVSAFAAMDRVDRAMCATMEFENGVFAQFETAIDSFERHRLEIAGEAGSIVLESPWFPGETGSEVVVVTPAGKKTIAAPGADCYVLEILDFMDALKNRRPPRWGAADATANMNAIDALNQSVLTGCAVSVVNEGG